MRSSLRTSRAVTRSSSIPLLVSFPAYAPEILCYPAPVATKSVVVNRSPVLTLWASIVAERLGYARSTALTLGKAVAGLNAQSKGRRLGIYEEGASAAPGRKPRKPSKPASGTVLLLGRAVPVVKTPKGRLAAANNRVESPDSVRRYLEQKFGAALPEVEAAMRALAKAYPPQQLESIGFSLYEEFRPEVPRGVKGWGAKGRLDLDRLRELIRSARDDQDDNT